jgi:hypothetical protein
MTRPCSTCQHLKRPEIDRRLAAGEPVAQVARAVLNALPPEDWADIALQMADRYGSLSQPDFEEKFSTLRRNIL